MEYKSGIYKNSNNTPNPDYEGIDDFIGLLDKLVIFDEDTQESVTSYTPEVMRSSDYYAVAKLLSERVTQLDGNSNFISECYNVDNYDDDMIYKLSSLTDIDYPLAYDSSKLKLLIECYPSIRKIRGEEKAVYMLLRILERSEEDLYTDDTDDTSITVTSNREWIIRNSRIQNAEFATYMLKKVIQTGLKFTFSNN